MFKMYELANNACPVVLNVPCFCFLATGSFPKVLENPNRYRPMKYSLVCFYCATQGNEFERN